jgi:hypothetical protein
MHYCGINFIYSFYAVHIEKVKRAMREAWNHPLLKNCKLFITNSNQKEVKDLGYTDLVLVDQMMVTFSKMRNGSESRPCFLSSKIIQTEAQAHVDL